MEVPDLEQLRREAAVEVASMQQVLRGRESLAREDS